MLQEKVITGGSKWVMAVAPGGYCDGGGPARGLDLGETPWLIPVIALGLVVDAVLERPDGGYAEYRARPAVRQLPGSTKAPGFRWVLLTSRRTVSPKVRNSRAAS